MKRKATTNANANATAATAGCSYCAEVLEEMKNMRQDFKKFIASVSTQMTSLSYEIKMLSKENNANNETNSCYSVKNNIQKKSTAFNPLTNRNKKPSSIKSFKSQSINNDDDDDDVIVRDEEYNEDDNVYNDNDNVDNDNVDNDEFFNNFITDISDERNSIYKSNENNEVKTIELPEKELNYEFEDFYHIKTRVMPRNPFKNIDEIRDWDHIIKIDSDQEEQLRKELKDDPNDAPGKYVRNILHQLLHKDLASKMTYRGNFKTNKYSMKEFYFTSIFKEVFLELFKFEDDYSYAHQIKGFFHYVNDRTRQKREAKKNETITSSQKEDVESILESSADKENDALSSSIVKMEYEVEKGEFESVEISIDEQVTTEIELLKEDVDIFEEI